MVWAGPAGSPDSLAVASGSIIAARSGPHKANKPLAARPAGRDNPLRTVSISYRRRGLARRNTVMIFLPKKVSGMFWKEYKGWMLEGAKTVQDKCPNCNNTADHFVFVVPSGLQFGLVFLKKPLVGKRKYYLTCSVCGYLAKELTGAQADAMRKTP